jgi:DNA-directed RNA polymerase specialized sigma24 family protein
MPGLKLNFQTAATSTQLLDSLKDESNQEVWAGLDARYRPILEGVTRRLGLLTEDAADVAQETLTRFVRDYRLGKYERGKGRLRTWIMTIARHRSIDLLRAHSRSLVRHGDTAMGVEPSEEAVQSAWESASARAPSTTSAAGSGDPLAGTATQRPPAVRDVLRGVALGGGRGRCVDGGGAARDVMPAGFGTLRPAWRDP